MFRKYTTTGMNNVLIVTSECVPFVRKGGLADVCAALPKAFDPAVWDVRVVLPAYSCIPAEYRDRFEKVIDFRMSAGPAITDRYVGVLRIVLNGITYYLIDNQDYFTGDQPYGQNKKDIEKYIFFDKAVLSMLPVIDFQPDLIHCHDWPSAMIPVYLRNEFVQQEFYQSIRTIMTVHNLKFQGIWDIPFFKSCTGFADDLFKIRTMEFRKNANMLKGGLLYADYITTVSPAYCREIQTVAFGEGLDGILSTRYMDMQGILNGIDTDFFDPFTDPLLFDNYPPSADCVDEVLEKKRANKEQLQEYLGMKKDPSLYMIGLLTKLVDNNGLDLIEGCIGGIVDDYTQFVIMGTGNPNYENLLRDYTWRYPDSVSANIRMDTELLHRMFAACDAVLLPSRQKPCGTTQMIALRYGSVPIVYETGGLKDSVAAFNEYSGTGNGFSFARYNSDDLLHIINYSKQIYYDKPDFWKRIVAAGLREDHSWESVQKQYADLYTYVIQNK